MWPARSSRPRLITRRRRRGAVLIEFVLILPLFLFLCMFSIDMGRLVIIAGAVNDATYVAARSGAQRGDAFEDDNAQIAFERARSSIPGASALEAPELVIVQGRCTSSNSYIVVEAAQEVPLITPGLGRLVGMVNQEPTFTVSSQATVLCEIVR